MDKKLLKILKELKNIQPDPDYSRRSRFLLLNSEGPTAQIKDRRGGRGGLVSALNGLFFNAGPVKLAFAVGVVIILVLIAGSVYRINNQLNQNNLVVKASEMNASIQVKLNEIKYLLENKPTDSKNILTVQELLGKATQELREVAAFDLNKGEDLSKSLEKIKSAQEIFYQIDALLTR